MNPEKLLEIFKTIRQIQELVKCPICLESITNSHELRCSHKFCVDCFETYCSTLPTQKKFCPLCKAIARTQRPKTKGIEIIGKFLYKINDLIRNDFDCDVLQLQSIENVQSILFENCEMYSLRKRTKSSEKCLCGGANNNSDKKKRGKKSANKISSSSPDNAASSSRPNNKKNESKLPTKSANINKINSPPNDAFDELLQSDYKNPLISDSRKQVTTYQNKNKKKPVDENADIDDVFEKMLSFEDCNNKSKIIDWLTDTRNDFDRLTQSQTPSDNFEKDYIPSLDMPSVSQIHADKSESRRPKLRNTSKNRIRSLDIEVKKIGAKPKLKRHSLSGDTPNHEDYTIDDEISPVQATEKILVDIMENRFLDMLDEQLELNKDKSEKGEIENVDEKKNHSLSGWDRMNDIKKTIKKKSKEPKKLNITLQNTQNQSKYTNNGDSPEKSDDSLYFQPTPKLRDENKCDIYYSPEKDKIYLSLTQENAPRENESVIIMSENPKLLVDQFQQFVRAFNNLSTTSTENLNDSLITIRDLYKELNINDKIEKCSRDIQTDALEKLKLCKETQTNTFISKETQTEVRKTETFCVKTQTDMFVNKEIQTDSREASNCYVETQTDLPLHKGIQTIVQNAESRTEIVQTETIFCSKCNNLQSNISIRNESQINADNSNITKQNKSLKENTPKRKSLNLSRSVEEEIVADLNNFRDDFCDNFIIDERSPRNNTQSKSNLNHNLSLKSQSSEVKKLSMKEKSRLLTEILDSVNFDTQNVMRNEDNHVENQQIDCKKSSNIAKEQEINFTDESLDDVQFETEEMLGNNLNENNVSLSGRNDLNKPIQGTIESHLICSIQSLGEMKLKRKRLLIADSDDSDLDNDPNRRPCQKFMKDNLCISFRSNIERSQIDNFQPDLVRSHNSEPPPKRTRTQEIIDQCEFLIENVTKSKLQLNQISQHSEAICDNKNIDTQISKSSRKCLFKSPSPEKWGNRQPENFSESLFGPDESHNDFEVNKENEMKINRSTSKVLTQRSNMNDINKSLDQIDKEVDLLKENIDYFNTNVTNNSNINKIVVIQNITLKSPNVKANTNNKMSDSPNQCSEDIDLSDIDMVETTPQKSSGSSNLQQRLSQFSRSSRSEAENDPLDITLPPPLQFQDNEDNDSDITVIDNDLTVMDDSSCIISQNAVSPVKKNRLVAKTSTPRSQRYNLTESSLSLSPIALTKPRVLGVMETVRQSKFSPLTITTTPISQRSVKSSLQKQQSILSYVKGDKKTTSSQSSLSKRSKPCVACTRLNKEQMIAVSSLTNKKLATYSQNFSASVTHMVVSLNENGLLKDHTIKYVSAVAAGIWVVGFDWVKQCLAKKSIVNEEPYEALDVSGAAGPRMSRLNRLTDPLFKGFLINVAPPFTSTNLLDVENVIRLLGGKVAERPEDLVDKKGYIRVIVTEAKATQDFDIYETWLEVLQVVTVDIEWLSRSIGQYKLLSLKPFALCSDDSICDLGYPAELYADVPFSFSQNNFTGP